MTFALLAFLPCALLVSQRGQSRVALVKAPLPPVCVQEVDCNADALLELDMELETARSRAAMSSSYRQQVESLQKELITLGEMYKRLEARLQASEPRPQVEAQAALLQEAALHEVAGERASCLAPQGTASYAKHSLSSTAQTRSHTCATRDGCETCSTRRE